MRDYILHFIRHGETLANEEGKYVGMTDLPLTDAAKKDLAALRDDGIYPAVGAVYASPLSRALETARLIYPGKPPVAVENLREYDFGDFEGKTANELDGDPDYAAWCAGTRPDAPNGESQEDFRARIYAGLVQIVRHMSETECFEAAVITHGGVIMTLLAVCGLPQRPAVEWLCEPGKGYTLRVNLSLFSRGGFAEVTGTVPEV